MGGASLTAVAAYNDQTNFFLTDGASDAFYLYAFTPSCAESFAARLGDTALPAPFNYGNPPGTIVTTRLTARPFSRLTGRPPAVAINISSVTRKTGARSCG